MLKRISESYRVRDSMDRTSRGSSASSRNKVGPATPVVAATPANGVDFIPEERRSTIWFTGGSEDTESTILPGNEEAWVDSPETSLSIDQQQQAFVAGERNQSQISPTAARGTNPVIVVGTIPQATGSGGTNSGGTGSTHNSPDNGMAPPKERRTSRGAIHPGGAATHIKDTFAPGVTRRCSTRTDWTGTPMPDTVSIPEFKNFGKMGELPEDTTGGLPPAEKNPDRDSLFFDDGKRRIDLVMVYEEEDIEVGPLPEVEHRRVETRKEFHLNLEKQGLELELQDRKESFDQKTYFLKVHVPWKVLTRYAEVMNIKMPIKRFLSISVKAWEGEDKQHEKPPDYPFLYPIFKFFEIFNLDSKLIDEEPSFYTATFSRDREEQFIIKDRETFFTSAQRSQVAWTILMRTKFDEDQKVGIRRLINNGTYLSAFPLHEGEYSRDAANGLRFDRRLLYLEWARPGRWYKKQPLWLVRKYFGDKIALYFAWLGFYTEMLIPAAIVGLLCFMYGILSMDSSDNIPSQEICNSSGPGSIVLCPMCDKVCQYTHLNESCLFAKVTYLFDNPATVFFAIFMSFWATTFLELWKRRQAVIAWEWDLQYTEEDEEPRPEFEASVKTFRINPVTRQKEPYMPPAQRAWRYTITVSTVFFMILVVCAAVLGTIVYRLSVVNYIYLSSDKFIKKHAKIFTSITGATLNLITIMILTRLYGEIAIWLTNQENPRTQIEYEDSYTFKIYFFEFMNFYSSLIYIAFFKGRFFSYPGDQDSRSSEFARIKGDVCDPAGCLFELCIQLAIIMVGKQLFNNFLELAYPAMINWWRKRAQKSQTKDKSRAYTRWEQDYQLQDPGRLALFEEYLEMVLQYGFVTLFVAAFPLAPFFALINNIGEIRLDAFKMVAQSRRPLAERVEDIGAWYGILQGVTYCAVVSNAFVIAYTSDYIPRMVYKLVYSKTNDLVGYIDSSLSAFNTTDYLDDMGVDKDGIDIMGPDPEICQYRGYRNGPEEDDKYGLSPQYWHVFAARLAFVVVFEHIVFALTGLMAYTIPDVPTEIHTQIQRERMLQKEAQFEHGLHGRKEEDEYDQMLNALRDSQNTSRLSDVIRRGSWGRRLSRQSSDEVPDGPKKTINTSTVWEVP